jgi:DNA topoisomerase-2
MKLNEIVTTLSEEEFMRNKSALAGTSDFVTAKMLVYENGKIAMKDNVKHIPSLFKIIDELIVNAYDHSINCIIKQTIQQKLNPNIGQRYVNNIIFSIENNGVMSIINDGYGIPIIKCTANNANNGDVYANDDDIYLPEKLFSSQRTGTNMQSDENRITGGTNGIGATIVTAFSEKLCLEICDEKYKYVQQKTDKFLPAIITDNAIQDKQYTKITFLIDWKNTKYKKFTKDVEKLFAEYAKKRLMQVKLLIDHNNIFAGKKPCSLALKRNGKIFAINTDDMFNTSHKFEMCIKPNYETTYPSALKIIIFVNDNKFLQYQQMSIINGVEVTKNPFLIHLEKSLMKIIANNCLAKKINIALKKLKDYFTLVMIGNIPNPQWVGQTKESFRIENSLLAKFNFKEEIDRIKIPLSNLMYEIIAANELNKKTKIQKVELSKYISCENHLSKKYGENYLFLPEGDSAAAFITNLLACKGPLNMKNSGILTLSGVPLNTFHSITRHYASDFKIIEVNTGGSKLLYKKKASENKFISEFRTVMKLDDCEEYNNAALIDKLPYNTIICATDPDLDGYGIGGSLIILLSKWPGLIKNRRFKLLHLPICRIIPSDINKNKAKYANGKFTYWEFFTQIELENWLQNNAVPSTHMIKYYKGLATIDQVFFPIIANNIGKYLFTIVYDKCADANIELFYGKYRIDENMQKINLANERKKMLCTPVRDMTEQEQEWYYRRKSRDIKGITISMYLEIFVKMYQLDNVKRKLLKLMDGRNNVTGKLLHTFMTAFGAKNRELLVSNIASKSKEETSYHHGETSIENAVISCGQIFPGKRLLPLLTECGTWGSRSDGGKNSCGAPRYIYGVLNETLVHSIFRKEDKIILPIQCEEGKIIEPYFYLPIIPLIALDNYITTGHGWKIEIWGRDFNDVMAYLLYLMACDLGKNANMPKLIRVSNKLTRGKIDYLEYEIKDANKFYTYDDDGNEIICDDIIREQKLFMYSTGIYKIIDFHGYETIHITELPVGKWTDNYILNLKNKISTKEGKTKKIIEGEFFHVIEQIRNNSHNDIIDIKIMLKENWRNHLQLNREVLNNCDDYDDIILKFGLRIRLNDELNVILPRIILPAKNIYCGKILENDLTICEGGIAMFNTFAEMISAWYKFRKYYYCRRIDRSKELLRLKILRMENIIRYMKNYTQLFGNGGKNKSEFIAILKNNGFMRFVKNFDPANIPDYEIISSQNTQKSSYSYLREIPSGSIIAENILASEQKLAGLHEKLRELEMPNAVINTWVKELKQVKV